MNTTKKTIARVALAGVAIAGTAAAAPPATKQVVTGPVATYWMSAQTSSGMTMGGGAPSLSSMMGIARGGNVSKSLTLQLGSARKPTGEPMAEHLPPAVLKAGASLPLLTPRAQPRAATREEPGMPQSYEKPRGKMLIYWGCGERARPGQPLVFDFAKMAEGQIPAGYSQLMNSLQVAAMQPPSPSRHATYGEWPNEKTRTTVPGDGSLLGPHTIKGNYSPQMQFVMAQGQDFLPAVQMTTNRRNPTGSFQLGWQPVAGATGYMASTMGGGDGESFVIWSSSEVQSLLFALPDYLRPADVQRLLANKALMSPTQTTCTVPKEVVDAAPQSMYQFVAWGGESNFTYPPRPTDPKVAWNIEWTVKVRYRSATGGILGMESPYGAGMGEGDDADDRAPADGARPARPAKKPKGTDLLRGLGVPIPGGL
jgi:hypothetical protein